ncbi:spore coat protein [Salipaludibacillus sp. CUR1]|uniref:spore coat protein n=1 Tax=Salipaludibacillus sp. CUR1 TaxID=2820003 RepID=UPI001E5F5ED8|nr:spore coat protein [Salipaludibacillus sp. CUR1]MCE7793174.1 spore coat protein [Salipaludibacillus sp. CUR1]
MATNELLEELTKQDAVNDEFLATEMATDAKAAILAYAVAVSEVLENKEAREKLKKHLNHAIDAHEEIVDYLVEKGIYEAPENLDEQLEKDIKQADKILELPKK